LRHDNILGSVVVFGTFTLVFGGLDFGLFVGRVEVLNDVGVKLLNLLLERGQALNSRKKS
jgi:hypothetical protein